MVNEDDEEQKSLNEHEFSGQQFISLDQREYEQQADSTYYQKVDGASITKKVKTKKPKNKIIVLDKSKNLPPELPQNLIYWNRCETRVRDEEELITNTQLIEFYREEFKHHEDMDGDVARVSDNPPFFRNKTMFADPKQEKFVSRAEERILKRNTFPAGLL